MIKPSFLSKPSIEMSAFQLRSQLKEYYKSDIFLDFEDGIDGEKLLEFLLHTDQITDFDYTYKEGLSEKFLGKFDFVNKVIYIYNGLKEKKGRENFTIAHEVGHLILHYPLYLTQCLDDEDDPQLLPFSLTSSSELVDCTNNRHDSSLEWQANYFASCFLMPAERFKSAFFYCLKQFGIKNRGFGFLYVDKQKCNIDNFFRVTDSLMNRFKTSREATFVRLKQLELVDKNCIIPRSDFDNRSIERIIRSKYPEIF